MSGQIQYGSVSLLTSATTHELREYLAGVRYRLSLLLFRTGAWPHARERHLRDQSAGDVARARTSIEALTLLEQITTGQLPCVAQATGVSVGNGCHFVAPVRFGRRSSDQHGQLTLTSGWVTFSGTMDVSLAWSEVVAVERSGRELTLTPADRRRLLRFTCRSAEEAACGVVIAERLRRITQTESRQPPRPARGDALLDVIEHA